MTMSTKRSSSSSESVFRERSSRRRKAFLFCAVALVAMVAGRASALGPDIPSDYRMVYANVVMRHGQRSRLVKSTTAEFGNNDGVALTAEGEQQCYEIGQQLKTRYIEDGNSPNITTKILGLSEFYDPDRFQVVSSGYERTLESASSLLLGLYPPGQTTSDVENFTLLWDNFIVVPIFSSDPANDMTILASDKCPVYTDNWIEFYRTDEFVQKEEDASVWISEVYEEFSNGKNAQTTPICYLEAEALEENKLKLHAPYNLWDCASVYATDGEEQAVDYIDVPAVPETSGASSGFEYLEELVNWIEDQKYEQALVGRMIGGLWIADMFNRFKQVVTHMRDNESPNSGRFPGMHITVGHYPTLKGIAGALDIGGLDGIPPYAAHFSFELMYNSSADYGAGEEDFGVRIMYQKDDSSENLNFVQMTPVFDDENSLDLDDGLASTRDFETGIMSWSLFSYLMEHQLAGEPVYYSGGEEDWCLDCLATEPDTCLGMELDRMTADWESQVAEVERLESDLADAGDKVEGHHVALLSIFGMILGIGIGVCIRPCLDRCVNKTVKVDKRTIAGDNGLESWPSSRSGRPMGAISATATGNGNGSFRLGVKTPPARHVLGGANGKRGGAVKAMPVPTTDEDVKIEENGDNYSSATTRIPQFAPTSILGEPVPFPHRRQPSGLSGVDSRMMTGVDGDHGDYDPSLTHSTTHEVATVEDGIGVGQSSTSSVQLT